MKLRSKLNVFRFKTQIFVHFMCTRHNQCIHINACVANGGWVLKDLGTDPNNPNPGRWDTPISLPYLQPSHEPRPPPQTPNQAPVTLNSTFNGETIEEKPLPPRIGRGGRGKTRKHTNATTPNAEPSQSHEAMRRHTSNTQRSR